MTDVRTPSPLRLHVRGAFAHLAARSARVLRIAAAGVGAALALCATPALAQSAFSADITFDQAPPQYAANQEVVASINLHGGSLPVSSIAFSATLPAGVTFVDPVLGNTCGGAASTSGTDFQLSGGAVAADTTCTVVLRVQAAPATPTSYTIGLPEIDYNEGGVDRIGKTSGTFNVDAGIPPTFSDSCRATATSACRTSTSSSSTARSR